MTYRTQLSRLWAALALLAMLGSVGEAQASDRLRVVASFSILADMAQEIGGDRVLVTALVGANADAHSFEPSPQQGAVIAKAQLVIANGLGFEPWLNRLIAATGASPPVIFASAGIVPRLTEPGNPASSPDPHAWQNVAFARVYAKNIAEALKSADPEGRDGYDSNLARYDAALQALDAKIRASLASLPIERRKIVTTHDAFFYFGQAYGLELMAPLGLSTEAEPSAQDIATLIRAIKRDKVPAAFLETSINPRLMNQIAVETGARLGGMLYSDALSEEKEPAGSYIAMMEANIRALMQALAP